MERKILIQFPTRERPEKFITYLDRYIEYLSNKEDYQINVSCDILDLTMNTTRMRDLLRSMPNIKLIYSNNKSKIEAVNAGVTLLKWDILIHASDDMWPMIKGYDNIIRDLFKKHFPDGDGVLHFNDGFQGEKLNTLSIMDRKFYDRLGHIYNPVYKSLYADNEFDEISRMLNKRVYIDQVIIKHEHPGNMNEIESDDLHKHNHTFLEGDKAIYIERKAKGYGLYTVGTDTVSKE